MYGRERQNSLQCHEFAPHGRGYDIGTGYNIILEDIFILIYDLVFLHFY